MAANASAIRRGPIFLDGTSTLLAETSFGNSTALPPAQWVEATHLPRTRANCFLVTYQEVAVIATGARRREAFASACRRALDAQLATLAPSHAAGV
jgi:hypothetical protein